MDIVGEHPPSVGEGHRYYLSGRSHNQREGKKNDFLKKKITSVTSPLSVIQITTRINLISYIYLPLAPQHFLFITVDTVPVHTLTD